MGNPNLDKQLRRAAKKGNTGEITRLLDAGADIESKGGFFTLGQSPLGHAVWYNQKEAVRVLLERGANTEARDDVGDTPLLIAVGLGRGELVDLLLAHGADPRGCADRADRDTPTAVAYRDKNYALAKRLEQAILDADLRKMKARDQARRDKDTAEKSAREAERRKNADVVIVNAPLGDRTLQEVYNFASLERISLVRKGEDGPVEAITRQNFSALGDKSGLRSAFAEHMRRGGTASESEVFSDGLQRIKPLPRIAP